MLLCYRDVMAEQGILPLFKPDRPSKNLNIDIRRSRSKASSLQDPFSPVYELYPSPLNLPPNMRKSGPLQIQRTGSLDNYPSPDILEATTSTSYEHVFYDETPFQGRYYQSSYRNTFNEGSEQMRHFSSSPYQRHKSFLQRSDRASFQNQPSFLQRQASFPSVYDQSNASSSSVMNNPSSPATIFSPNPASPIDFSWNSFQQNPNYASSLPNDLASNQQHEISSSFNDANAPFHQNNEKSDLSSSFTQNFITQSLHELSSSYNQNQSADLSFYQNFTPTDSSNSFHHDFSYDSFQQRKHAQMAQSLPNFQHNNFMDQYQKNLHSALGTPAHFGPNSFQSDFLSCNLAPQHSENVPSKNISHESSASENRQNDSSLAQNFTQPSLEKERGLEK